MKVTVTVTGDKGILGSLSMLDIAGRSRLEKQVDRSSAAILAGAQERVPVGGAHDPHPGELKKTLRRKVSTSGMSAAVMAGYGELARKGKSAAARARGVAVNEGRGVYAPPVEFGTQDAAAHPFLFPALEDEKPSFIAGCGDALKGAVSDAEKAG